MSDVLYDLDEVTTTAELDAAPVGSVLVTSLGEGRPWIKVGTRSWVSVVNGAYTSRKRPGHWFSLKAPVIVWEAPEGGESLTADKDLAFFETSEFKLMHVGQHLSRVIDDAADTFHIPLDVRTRIVTAILAGSAR